MHGIGGIQAVESSSGVWSWVLSDGQGSVRAVMPSGTSIVPTETRQYALYGTRSQLLGSPQTDYGYTGEPLDEDGLIYLRARYYSPALGVFASLDPLEGIAGRPMSLNGYSWVEGNTPNAVDPSGLCAQPRQFGNPFDDACYGAASALAHRLSQGDSGAFDNWYAVLIQRELIELTAIQGLAVLNDAAIIPMLLRDNPQATGQALQTWLSTPQNVANFACQLGGVFGIAAAGSRTIGSTGVGAGTSALGTLGTILTLGLGLLITLLAAGTASNTQEEDPCSEEKMRERIGGRMIHEVVGAVGNIRLGEPGLYKGYTPLGHKGVLAKAVDICKTGHTETDFSEYYTCAPGLYCPDRILSDGNATFVARRLVGQGFAFIEANFLRESTAAYGTGILEDEGDRDYFYGPDFDWATAAWLDT